ncbi:bifunctional adenosylcobinamide kinase/adenosylcobinamide-phosphate guanylyltransferase [Thioalkalivibrio versutus]|uniref:bifunctional adenosylcobinamide kinase/adenosylcobinamide-phosphate guanylyltransferase n=1 Tax=Thioalkalivibrio versutus TaxID=106634 RepID=UPI000382909D|nr:bifunctional adenosylcobinamide kinase/adenosylcobinamide-phosphate guanylyltransferase [Thioalkalivibrio versutus]OOC50935.1 bifunctional adenosylcobinamide kinase/adenosylcobinamide-phosphate guanylyltransferase [Thioalkalivibrio versutus]
MKTLVLGGVRSGKSRLAEQLAAASGLPVTYVATARADDAEMARRIERHRADRPGDWGLVEAGTGLARALEQTAGPEQCLLVDCLTLWLTQLLCTDDEGRIEREREALIETVPRLPGTLVFVSNETGMGITPMDALSRRFADEAGWLHQRLAPAMDRVVLTVAGLPHVLKGHPL